MDIFKLVGSVVIDDGKALKDLDKLSGKAESNTGKIGRFFSKMGGGIGKTFSGVSNDAESSTNKVGGFFSKMGNGLGSMASGITKVAGAVGVLQLVNSAMNVLSNSISGAISRVDTLNQFPRVLEQMGYSAEEAQASTQRLAEGIDGLPTTLDDISGSTQRMVTILGDVDLATESALALNNAFLASGASQEEASRGMQQYTQMLSSGKVDMQSWRTLQETMPYALKETAEAFGFAGKSAQNDLYSALQSGQITVEEFNGKIIELSNATGGFAETSKESTRGIGTSWQNILTSIVNGVANVIQAFDDWLASNGFGGIPEILDIIKEKVGGMFASIVEWVPVAMDAIMGFVETIKGLFSGESIDVTSIIDSFAEILPQMVTKGQEIVQNLVSGILQNLPAITDTVVTMIQSYLSNLTSMYPMLLTAGIEILVSLINGIVQAMPQIASAILTVINTLISTIITLLPMILNAGIQLLMALIQGIIQILPQLVPVALSAIMTLVNGLVASLPMIIQAGIQLINALVAGIISFLPTLVPMAMQIINTLLNAILTHLPTILHAGVQLLVALINGIVSILPQLLTTAIQLIISLAGAILSNLPMLISAGVRILLALISGILQTIPQLLSSVLQIGNSVIKGIMSVDYLSIGINIVKGIISGVGSMAGSLVTAVKDVAKSAYEGAKNFLGIHSPSRLFRDEIGKYIPAGIAVGIEDNADMPYDALNKSLGIDGYDFGGTMNGTVNHEGGANGSGREVNQNITINSPKSLNAIETARQFKKANRQLALGV